MRYVLTVLMLAIGATQVAANDKLPNRDLSVYDKVDIYWYQFDSDARIQLIATNADVARMESYITCAVAELVLLNGLTSFAPVGYKTDSYDAAVTVEVTYVLSDAAGTGITRFDARERYDSCASMNVAGIL